MTTTIVKTIRAAGGDFTSLSAWEATIPADLVAVDEQWIAECFNDWVDGLNDRLIIHARPTLSGNNVVVKASELDGTVGRSKHLGDPSAGFYIKKATNFWRCLQSETIDYLLVQDIRFDKGSTLGDCATLTGNNYTSKFVNCIASNSGTDATDKGFGLARAVAESCLAINCGNKGIGTSNNYYGARIYDSVAVNCPIGFYGQTGNVANDNQNVELKNCVSFNCTTDYDIQALKTSSSNNATSASTIDSSIGTVANVASTDFKDTANDDYHLSDASNLKGAGLNLITSGDLSSPQYDIDGDQWPDSGAWDIGFDYYVTASGGTTTGTLEGTLPSLTASFDGTFYGDFDGTLDGTLPSLTGDFNGSVGASGDFDGTLDGTLPSLTANFNGTFYGDFDGTLDGMLPSLTANFDGTVSDPDNFDATFDGVLPSLTANFDGTFYGYFDGTLDGTLPSLTGDFNGSVVNAVTGTLDGALPSITASFAGTVPSLDAWTLQANSSTPWTEQNSESTIWTEIPKNRSTIS